MRGYTIPNLPVPLSPGFCYDVGMSAHILKNLHTVEELLGLKNKSKDEGQKLRLRAIINIKKGKLLKQVSEELLISRRSLSTWVHRYNNEGVNGFKTNKGGRPEGNPTWDTAIWDGLTALITEKGGYWSIPKMQEWIMETYKKSIPEQTVWYNLNKLNFSYKSSRPHPYLGDEEKQSVFKKKWSH